VGVLILLAVFGLFIFANTFNPNPIVNGDLLKQCNPPPAVTVQNTGPNTSQKEEFFLPVFLASPGTSSKLCVEYFSNNSSATEHVQLSAQAIAINGSAAGIQVSPEPSELTVLRNPGLSPTGYSVAVYTLNFSESSRGFYTLNITGDCLLFASGYSASQINESDFGSTLLHHALDCYGAGDSQVSIQIESYLNLNETLLQVT